MRFSGDDGKVKFMILNPGHFHAALVQKSMYEQADSVVYVFAPEGPDLDAYLSSVKSYNNREKEPTNCDLQVYTGPDIWKMI